MFERIRFKKFYTVLYTDKSATNCSSLIILLQKSAYLAEEIKCFSTALFAARPVNVSELILSPKLCITSEQLRICWALLLPENDGWNIKETVIGSGNYLRTIPSIQQRRNHRPRYFQHSSDFLYLVFASNAIRVQRPAKNNVDGRPMVQNAFGLQF